MRVIPVLDLRDAQAVHARAGNRNNYLPLRSVWHASGEPLALAQALRDQGRARELYIADLNALQGSPRQDDLIADLCVMGLDVWLDAAVRTVADAAHCRDLGAEVVIAGLETLDGPATLDAVLARIGSRHVAFSLDLRDGVPLVETRDAWGRDEPLAIVERAVAGGLSRLIVLDLARVGTRAGLANEALARRIRGRWPRVELIVGGGVASVEDLTTLARDGVQAALVGTAVHAGVVPPDWAR